MHFKTLVTVNMPTVEEDPHENAAVEQSIELLQARKDDLAKDIMAELTLCSLMGRTTNFARQLVGAVEEVMTPYSTEPPEEYKEFADMTEELKADYILPAAFAPRVKAAVAAAVEQAARDSGVARSFS